MVGIAFVQEFLDCPVSPLPDRNGTRKQSPSPWRHRHQTGAMVLRIRCDVEQTAALQGLENGRQSGSIHRGQRRY
jgi:hypothetical protein